MRKIFLALPIVLFAVTAFALDWFYPNQQTISWAALSVQDVTYNVYLCEHGDYARLTLQGNTADLRYVLTIPRDGKSYVAGVSAVVGDYESDINWSDVNGASTPNPFGFVTLRPPENLRRVEEK